MPVLDCDQVLYFWVAWGNIGANAIGVALGEGEYVYEKEIMSFNATSIYDINAISLSTGWGSQGTWQWDIAQGKIICSLFAHNIIYTFIHY